MSPMRRAVALSSACRLDAFVENSIGVDLGRGSPV